MRRKLITMMLIVVAIFIETNGFTQDKKRPMAEGKSINTPENQRINAFMVDKIIGSKVINMKGESLGKIEDLVVDVDTGKILFVILESGGFLSIGDKLLPVPWKYLAALPSEGLFFLNQSKEQMEKAPVFDKNNMPNIEDRNWGEGIFKYYGVAGYRPPGAVGYRFDYDSEGGYFGDPIHHGPDRGEDSLDKLFDPKTMRSFSGQVIKVDTVPETGYGMEMRLTVFVEKKEVLPVYLGPSYYIVGSEREKYFKIGDKVVVTGSQITSHGEPFVLATTVKRGNEMLRLRDKEGLPEWVGWKKSTD